MVHGGQGAPLVPVYHAALAANVAEATLPICFVNIGGISNLTFIGSTGGIVAYDCGPGNTLIDQWVEAQAGVLFDQDGAIAARGTVIPQLAERYLGNPFFTSNKRMSLDRNDFRPLAESDAGLHDGARTLAYVTAAAVLKSMRHLPEKPALIKVCGGGRLNGVIMDDLSALADGAKVARAEEFGFNGDSMEAEAWAYLAVRSDRGLPLTFPGTTDVDEPVTGGVTARPDIVETSRLVLTPWQRGDAALIEKLHGTPEASRYIGAGTPWTLGYAEQRMSGWMEGFHRNGIAKLKLVSRDDGRFIGRAGFSFFEESGHFELGYCLAPEEWGKGYATEIASALSEWFFEHRPERKFLAFAHADNSASIHVLRKIGMTEIEPRDVAGRPCRFFEMVAKSG
jgi:RimJ/RimL family protein N-acetyltransferase